MSDILDQFAGKDVVFIGLGQGRSAAGIQSYLAKHSSMASFTGVNQDPKTPADPWASLKVYPSETTVFIKNEGVPGRLVPVPYVAPMQLFFDLLAPTGATTIGITGTKGKSTTTSLVATMLEKSGKQVFLCGNIGTSVFSYLDEATTESIFVIELSSYQLADMHTSPHISCCINLYFDHADWHGSKEAYWEAKHNIMRFATGDDYFVYNKAFPELEAWASSATCHVEPFAADETIDMGKSTLLGEHNRLNALAARHVALLGGATKDGVQSALDEFQPLHHRLETVAVKNGVTYIDDGIATTPEATLAALAAVTKAVGPVGCLMLGGEDRGSDFGELLQMTKQLAIPALVLFPESGERMQKELPSGYEPQMLVTRDMSEAVRFAAAHSPSGSVVLLSTASASYSIWPEGFEQKGRQFLDKVLELA